MKRLHQEVVRAVLLDGQLRCITKVDISSGTVNESFAAPREIFRPAIIHSAYAFVLVHNHPSRTTTPSEADRELTKRVAAAAQILQIKFLDHVIVGEGFFSFQESGIDTPILESPSPKQFEDDDENERRCECLASPESIRHRGGPPAQEYRLRLKPPSPHL